MKFRIFILVFSLFFSSSFAQKKQDFHDLETHIIVDSAVYKNDQNFVETDSILQSDYYTENKVAPRTFEDNFRAKYKEKDFDYETVKPRESLWERIKRRIAKILESIFGKMEPNTSVTATRTVFWLLIIIVSAVLIYFLLNYLINREGTFFFSKKNKKNEISNEDIHENIHEINFPENILKFEKEKNFRWAIRYQFLYILKKLSDKKLIEWNPEKTNKDYLKEFKNAEAKDEFQELARIFDHVWYGEFDIDEGNYNYFSQKFRNIKI